MCGECDIDGAFSPFLLLKPYGSLCQNVRNYSGCLPSEFCIFFQLISRRQSQSIAAYLAENADRKFIRPCPVLGYSTASDPLFKAIVSCDLEHLVEHGNRHRESSDSIIVDRRFRYVQVFGKLLAVAVLRCGLLDQFLLQFRWERNPVFLSVRASGPSSFHGIQRSHFCIAR